VHDRVLRPLLAADQQPAPSEIRKTLHIRNIHTEQCIDNTRLLPTAA
jgi:hypothetical protein